MFNPFKTSKLGLLNFWLVQFFFVRVFWYGEEDGREGYGILGPVLPLTGWWSDYIPEPRFKRNIT